MSTDGTLLDGMHRCLAIVKADRPVEMMVAYGVPPEALTVLDTGSPRSLGDHLLATGRTHNYQGEAAAIRLLWHLLRGEMGHSAEYMVPDIDQLADLAERHPGIADWSTPGRTIGRRIGLPGSAVIVALYATWISSDPDSGTHGEFWNPVSTGAGLQIGDPRLALHNFGHIRAARARGRSTSATRIDRSLSLQVMIRMWNAWGRGTQVHRIQATDRKVHYPKDWPFARS